MEAEFIDSLHREMSLITAKAEEAFFAKDRTGLKYWSGAANGMQIAIDLAEKKIKNESKTRHPVRKIELE